MRILLHDYSGHPFQVELSRELSRRGHDVTHSYCDAYTSGKGHLRTEPGETLAFEPIGVDVVIAAGGDGTVRTVDELRGVVEAARRVGAVVVADECYAELAWGEPWASAGVPSVLDPRVTGGDLTGVLALYSLSKQSNLAGYRAAFAAGDPVLVSRLLEVRKHAGMIVPGPVQAAMTAALGDDAHVAAQREVYRRRRAVLLTGLADAGLTVDGSEAGLYLWARPEAGSQDCWTTVSDLAEQGILVAPGSFYGSAGTGHVRIALTASDERVGEAAARLTGA